MKKAEIHVPELLLRKNPKNPLKLYKSLCDIDKEFFIKYWLLIDPFDIANS